MSSLEERLSQGPLPPGEAVRLVWHVCDFAQNGVVLGEVPPARVELIDGGIRLKAPVAGGAPVPGYTAPERRTSAPSPASDVYSMGCLLYACITGWPPFERSLPPSATHLEEVLARALAPEPASRWASVVDLKRALTGLDQTLISGSRTTSSPGLKAATLGPWALESVLGEGTMGQVFRARHSMLGRLAAIKVLRSDQYQNPELVQRFFQEARTVNQINHEHIVEISDFVQEPGPSGPSAVYCVMELLQGMTLGAAMREKSLPIARTVHIMRQVADALAAAHRVGVVHRDVKPDNIMLIERGGQSDYVKVLDFGVAKLTGGDEKAMVATTEGAIIGTPICMSPEQARGDDVDARSDVWAVGVILYRLLSGQYPFDAPNFVNMAVQIITKPVPPLPAKTAGGEPFPASLANLIQRCLAKDREQRLGSMEEVRQALDDLRSPRGVAAAVSSSPAAATSTSGSGRGRGRWLALGALVVGAVGSVAAYALWPKPPMPVEVDAGTPDIAPASVDSGVVDAFDAGFVEPMVVDAGVVAVIDAGLVAMADAGVARPVRLPARLTEEMLKPATKRFQQVVQSCLLQGAPALQVRKGSVRVKFSAEPGGSISEVTLEGLEPSTTQCVLKRLPTLTYPRHTGPAQKVGFGFDFKLE